MFRKTTTVLVVASLLLTAASPAAASFGESETPPIQRFGAESTPSYVFEFEDGSAESVQNWANASTERTLLRIDNESNTATVTAPKPHITGLPVTVDGFDPDIFTGTQLEDESWVESVHPNYRLQYAEPVRLTSNSSWETPTVGLTSVNDPEYPLEGVAFSEDTEKTTMSEAREYVGADNVSAGGSGLTVAVVDTGANVANGQVFGNGTDGSTLRISQASASFLGSGVTTVNESGWSAIEDKNGHGTWTASAIAANASGTVHDGTAPDATLLVLKALDDDGEGSASDIAAAIRYAADHNASVISLSLGSPVHTEAIVDAVNYATSQGSVVVVAAGNSRQTRSPGVGTPGDVAGGITVGASNGSDAGSAWSAYFSQTAGTQASDGNLTNEEPVDVVAPGMEVTARVAGTDGLIQNNTLSGTSMATPIVAGGIAKAMAANSTLKTSSPAEIHDSVAASARPAPNMATAEAGNGMFATDNLATGTTPETSQTDSMTDPAQQRQEYYEAVASAGGGFLAGVADRVGV